MIINDMFAKPISRDLQGVITVGRDDRANMQQELEEYVVTPELQKHFRDFFASYKRSITGTTPKMGVWISGFFGSGKSHFLKILAYLLENKEIGGKRALDYFKEDGKIDDPAVFADMTLAAQTPADVISFNIAAKSGSTGRRQKDAIVNVFLRVFNEMQGFCGAIPWVADLERQLSESGRYGEFRDTYRKLCGAGWEESRDDFDYVQDDVVETLTAMGFMSEAAARNWCEKAVGEFTLSIEDFAGRVQEYIARQEKNHHVVFLVDEVGQYVGSDSRLMLDLQTLTEELGKQCGGKAWIVVTSQQDIDAVTKVRGSDFSKIQGRFDTRLSLSSANVDAVIKKRILDKNDVAAQTLRLLYGQEDTVIKNLITFSDSVEKKLYADADDFAAVYPFIPYQFDMMAAVLNSIRRHGASGKHLSEGERSMLAMFKESAMAYGAYPVGTLIPLHAFYNALENFLDHSHRSVVIKAYDNSRINPDKEQSVFAVDVLKTLFLIKYLQTVTATADNIATLMLTSLGDDRITLKEQVQKALDVLISQNLVQKNGGIYVFLTDEEQEINREIRSENIESGEITAKTAELIFDDIFTDKKYRHPKFKGRYTFAFDQFVDDHPYKTHGANDIAVHILTPDADEADSQTLRWKSQQERAVLVVLPPDQTFMDELRLHLQIKKFLQRSLAGSRYKDIEEAKRREMNEREKTARLFLVESLKKADIYINGSEADIGAKDAASRLREGLDSLVQHVYYKLSYIDTPMDDDDILRALNTDTRPAMALETDSEANSGALQDVLSFITDNTRRHIRTSMKTLKERFMKSPYGFVDNDVEWLAARLFKRGDLSFYVNGEEVTLAAYTPKTAAEYITKKQYAEKLLMERRERVPEREKKLVKEAMRDLFGSAAASDEEDVIMKTFRDRARQLDGELKDLKTAYYDREPRYPGCRIVRDGRRLLDELLRSGPAKAFFAAAAEHADDLMDLSEDLSPIRTFFKGEQKTCFDKALKALDIFRESKEYIDDDELQTLVGRIDQIIHMPEPYRDVPELPGLTDQFNLLFVQLLEKEAEPVKAEIEAARAAVMAELDGKPYQQEKAGAYAKEFDDLLAQAARSRDIMRLRSCADKADALRRKLCKDMERADEAQAKKEHEAKAREAAQGNGTAGKQDAVAAQPKPYAAPKTRTVRIRDVMPARGQRLQTAADVDAYVAALKKRLLDELGENTVVYIEY